MVMFPNACQEQYQKILSLSWWLKLLASTEASSPTSLKYPAFWASPDHLFGKTNSLLCKKIAWERSDLTIAVPFHAAGDLGMDCSTSSWVLRWAVWQLTLSATKLQVYKDIFVSMMLSFPLLCHSSFLCSSSHHQWSSDLFLHLTFLLQHLLLNASENRDQAPFWQKLSIWGEMVPSYLYSLSWTFSSNKMLGR